MAVTTDDSTNDSFFRLMRQRFQEAEAAEAENRAAALDDLKFIHNYEDSQWSAADRMERNIDRRPMLTNNLLRKFLRSLMGAMKQSRPGIKVSPVDSVGDVNVAEIMTDMIRQIENDNESPAHQAYDKAYEGALSNSFGYMRIVTNFEKEESFNQKLQIKRVENPFTVYFDPLCKNFLRTDARYAFVHTLMDRAEFERRWPNATPGDASMGVTHGEAYEGWFLQDAVRIAEYFYAIPTLKDLVMLNDLSIVELNEKVTEAVIARSGKQIIKRKKVVAHRYMWAKVSGNELLEAPRVWPGKFIPIVPVYGDEVNIEGRRVLYSFFRDAQDPQRMYNFWLTAATEMVSMAPKAPYVGTTKQFKGHEKEWREANRKNYAYLAYEPDNKAKMPPQRQQTSDIPAGHITMLNIARGNVMNTLGLFESSVGQKSNERSGKAILARQSAGDRVTFSYLDNFYQAVLLLGYMLVDLIPAIYDTTRILRLKKDDGSLQFINANMPHYDPDTDSVKITNDLTMGEYDTELDISPSYATRRQEASASMIEFLQYVPGAAPLIADLIAKNMDWPGAQEISARLKAAAAQAPAETTTA